MPVSPFKFTYDNTFCISLEKSQKRWNKMRNQFDFFNMNVQRWNASTPDNITDNFVNYLSGEQKACTQSHINIYRHIIENNIDYAFILEDDACFDLSWKSKLDEFTNNISEEQYNNLNMVLLNASEPMDKLFEWDLQTEQYLCGGYIITKKGALWILNNFQDLFFMSDWITTRLQLYDGNCYSYFPWLIIQEGIDSTIQPNGNCDADYNKVVNCLNKINYSIKDNYITNQLPSIKPLKKRIFCFWTGDNEMSQNRKNNLIALKEHSNCEVVLVTPDNLNEYILPDHPLHESYSYLSFTHKADYLRTYFMHFHGGGYSDIKDTPSDWNEAFDDINSINSIYINGYKETRPEDVSNNDVKHLYDKLTGNCCYIVRPMTKFTNEWYSNLISLMDEKLPQLQAMGIIPHPQDCNECTPEYPISWNEMLGRIYHKVLSNYIDEGRILYTVPYPIIHNYK